MWTAQAAAHEGRELPRGERGSAPHGTGQGEGPARPVYVSGPLGPIQPEGLYGPYPEPEGN